ncbi:MAG: hypothetical protein PHR43_03565 [Dehalococcoidales bacterium]|nr:hypothetical protein [Dehalococcoidales bacterium]
MNVLLPFVFAWGRAAGQPELAQKALELYRCYPVLTGNRIERHMREKLRLNDVAINTACRKQGLLQIHQAMCLTGRCDRCSLRI